MSKRKRIEFESDENASTTATPKPEKGAEAEKDDDLPRGISAKTCAEILAKHVPQNILCDIVRKRLCERNERKQNPSSSQPGKYKSLGKRRLAQLEEVLNPFAQIVAAAPTSSSSATPPVTAVASKESLETTTLIKESALEPSGTAASTLAAKAIKMSIEIDKKNKDDTVKSDKAKTKSKTNSKTKLVTKDEFEIEPTDLSTLFNVAENLTMLKTYWKIIPQEIKDNTLEDIAMKKKLQKIKRMRTNAESSVDITSANASSLLGKVFSGSYSYRIDDLYRVVGFTKKMVIVEQIGFTNKTEFSASIDLTSLPVLDIKTCPKSVKDDDDYSLAKIKNDGQGMVLVINKKWCLPLEGNENVYTCSWCEY